MTSHACRAVFDTASVVRGSAWGRFNVLFPELRPLTICLSRLFPDKPLSTNLQVGAKRGRKVCMHSGSKYKLNKQIGHVWL